MLDLPVLTHPFPTRRSSDMGGDRVAAHGSAGRADIGDDLRNDIGMQCPQRSIGLDVAIVPRGGVPDKLIGAHQATETVSERSDGRHVLVPVGLKPRQPRWEEHTSGPQSLMRNLYSVFEMQ